MPQTRNEKAAGNPAALFFWGEGGSANVRIHWPARPFCEDPVQGWVSAHMRLPYLGIDFPNWARKIAILSSILALVTDGLWRAAFRLPLGSGRAAQDFDRK